MTIPPFPSQDLAKLVLGYLAEEQLMTAYDEFLQASPYLDAFRNEYDRIFMTSLKNILAEYRAVKIYVETCKPFLLRRKMLQCSNLLDVVKLLISYADISKLQSQDSICDRTGMSKHNTSGGSKHNVCDICVSLNLAVCVCQSKQNRSLVQSGSHGDNKSIENSIETTALEDLPGNQITTRKKHTRPIDKESSFECTLDVSDNTRQLASVYNSSGVNSNQSSITKHNEIGSLNLSSIVKVSDTPECREKMEEFNNILNKVCNNKSMNDTRMYNTESDSLTRKPSSFAPLVSGQENRNIPVPDSSTSENSINVQSLTKENSTSVSHTSSESQDVNDRMIQTSNYPYPRIKPKPNDKKIKIISDIKVDSPFPKLNNGTSTPLMQTIVINGTPAYKQKLPAANDNYTKDEIMAMPTIIVVPTSGPPQRSSERQPVLSQKLKKLKTKTTSKKILGPLVIDVSSPVVINKDSTQSAVSLQNSTEPGLVRTVDTKNASVPKDNTISDSTQTSTPQVLPPVRKSSSTPRRNSHIRVLDFTTPRRILHETIHESVPQEVKENPVEVLITGSPNIVFPETSNSTGNIIDMSSVKIHKIETCHISNTIESKSKKSNWDADLRALAVAGEKTAPQAAVKKPRVRNSKKKVDKSNERQENSKDAEENLECKRVRSKRKISPKDKTSKRRKLEEEEAQYNDAVQSNETNVTVKPTFNIVTADQQSTIQDTDKLSEGQNKSNDEQVRETPEAERLLLQNAIGAKLNISDLLETPYKQALYDIQMETPKFLGSVLPDEPISDIKIMNIPTPRFFDTPKPPQATPSYSSRATDYSSGGSYYKPDEHDYLRIPELECPVTSSKEITNTELSRDINNGVKKSSRPVRKCTKNVSYRDHKAKGKSADDKVENASSCSETASVNSSMESSKEVVKTPRTPRESKQKSQLKSESKKKTDLSERKKTPTKKDRPSIFMKIKPRRPTPTKDGRKTKRKSIAHATLSPRTQARKKCIGKDKSVHITPAVVSAPTKSRRKSSTPRKLHCTKPFNSESSAESPENVSSAKEQAPVTSICQDSDTEQLALRWSDDGSQDAKPRSSECEDITKIKQYIESTLPIKSDYADGKGTLQGDLIRRGFDAETAKIIERDLLDTPDLDPPDLDQNRDVCVTIPEIKMQRESCQPTVDKDTSVANELNDKEDEAEEDDLELSSYECNEGSDNYIVCSSDAKDISTGTPVTLKDTWTMEVCIDDGVPIRLKPTTFSTLFDNPPQDVEVGYSFRETEVAVSSISNLDMLDTPLKDRRTQCYEIFDSTLTSLDTPLKLSSPKDIIHKTTEIEIVVEEEKIESKDIKKRRRLQNSSSPDCSLNEIKKTKPETQYLFNSTNIQNIDIESVLKKLHGP